MSFMRQHSTFSGHELVIMAYWMVQQIVGLEDRAIRGRGRIFGWRREDTGG